MALRWGSLLGGALVLLVVACSSGAGVVVTAADGGSSADGEADASGVPFVAVAPWTSSSARVELSSFGFFQGSMKYAKDRAELMPAQLQALEGLRTQAAGAPRLAEDRETFTVSIVGADGVRATYGVAEDDGTIGGPAGALSKLDKRTLDPFLATLKCMKAKATTGCLASPGGALPATCTYAKVGTDAGCLNGVFVSYPCADVWTKLTIPTAGTYEITTVECMETVGIKLLAADDVTVLASAAPAAKPTCSSVTHAFDAPGTFSLVLEKRNVSGCAANGAAGDFYLRVLPKP